MGKRILILDDDVDFNSLLTDIFSQADYDVVSERDPEVAVGVFRNNEFDLVVTDQKMPGLSGEEFIREIKAMRPDIPVIMVSGYLDNDTIRRLIQEGVGGVFLKPLNVFSLLKRTAALIEEREAGKRRKAQQQSEEQQGDGEPDEYQHTLPFVFKSLPCKSPVSVEFAKKLYSLRNFKTNLIMIAPPGSDVKGVVQDLRGFDPAGVEAFFFVDPRKLTLEDLPGLIDEGLRDGAQRVTLVLSNAERLSGPQKKAVFKASSKEPPFSELTVPLRFIFHISGDLDELYDAGQIDDDLYMFMGTSEIRMPALADIREDVPLLAMRFMREEAERKEIDPVPALAPPARVFLRDWDWSGNASELRRFMGEALALEKPTLSREDFKEVAARIRAAAGNKSLDLHHELGNYQRDICQAVVMLCGGDEVRAAEILQVCPELVLAVMAGQSVSETVNAN